MTTKFETKIIGRLLDRLDKNGLNAALKYGVAVCGGNPQITRAVLSSVPEPLKTMLDASFLAKRSMKQLACDAMDARQAEVVQARKFAHEAIISDFKSARRIGQATVFLAGLTMAERTLCNATKKEVDAAMDMRRNCIRSTKLKEILKCTQAELKRWSTDGRLPVMFRRRMPSSVGVTLDVRHWDTLLIQEALQHLSQWREDDARGKRRKQSAQ